MKGSTSSVKRSRTGCLACKARKVKCDERPNGCRNCERLRLHCSRDVRHDTRATPASAKPPDDRGHRRYRSFGSCRGCRMAKVRCSADRPTCLRCRSRAVECFYETKEAPKWLAKVSVSESAEATRSLNRSDSTRFVEEAGNTTGNDKRSIEECTNYEKSERLKVRGRGERANTHGEDHTLYNDNAKQSLSWLLTSSLPDLEDILLLVEEYFKVIHPLRAFGFIHKPTFLESLEDQTSSQRNSNVLVLVVCALGAKLLAARQAHKLQSPDDFALRAGNQWSCRAKQLLFSCLNHPSIELAMSAVLLHEHDIRIGNYASAFTITGLVVRLSQGLQTNVEVASSKSRTPGEAISHSQRECRRRLMWSIYTMDAWVGSGVDELTMINEGNIKVQLPCSEAAFIFETETQPVYLRSPHPMAVTGSQHQESDIIGHFLRLVSIRRRVLRYVKYLEATLPPWSPESEYAVLQTNLQHWQDDLPASLQFTRSALHQRKVSDQHGALLFLHLTYHQTMCDLTRIGMKELFRIRVPIVFPPEQTPFLQQVQDRCFESCMIVSSVLQECLKQGLEALADTWLCVVAHDASRVIVHYASKSLGTSSQYRKADLQSRARAAVQTNAQALEQMIPIQALAKSLHRATASLAKSASLDIESSINRSSELGAVSDHNQSLQPEVASDQMTPEQVLNPLAIYRMATRDIQERGEAGIELTPVDSPPKSPSRLEGQPEGEPEVSADAVAISGPDPCSNMPLEAPPSEMADWSMSQMFPLPTSFDDLQTYMQLPLMTTSEFGPYGLATGTDVNFDAAVGFDEQVPSAPLDFSLQVPNVNTEFSGDPGQNYGWPR